MDDENSVFKPIVPIQKPPEEPVPENTENPFIALSPELTHVDLPKNWGKPLRQAATPPQKNGQSSAQESNAQSSDRASDRASTQANATASPTARPVNFLNENVSISIAPEFMPSPTQPPPKTEMDFSHDYKNPEADRLQSRMAQDRTCYRCSRPSQQTTVFMSDKGPVCPRCFNPYRHRLISAMVDEQEEPSVFFRAGIAATHFIASWLVPIVPAMIWYGIFVHTGTGTIFEDCAAIVAAPTIGTLVFFALILAGIFLIPASIASVALGKTLPESLGRINPAHLFPLVNDSLLAYYAICGVLVLTVLINLAGCALLSEWGVTMTAGVLALPVSVCLSAVEMALIRWLSGMVMAGPDRKESPAGRKKDGYCRETGRRPAA